MRTFTDDALLVEWQARRISWMLPLIVGVQAVLAVWCAAGFTASYAAMNRRG